MTSTLSELCKNIQMCTEKLEEEIKKNIDDCHRLLINNEATETKLALEKAKDFHYKEILDILRVVVTNIRKIIFHEEKIRTLSDENNLTPEELKRYSYVQRQINVFSNNEDYSAKREKRRVASEVSLESLEAWEQYLEKKSEGESAVQLETSEIPKRKKMNSKRRKKKFVSSTFNNFLDDKTGQRKLDSILESDVQEDELDLNDRPLDEDRTVDNLTLESGTGINIRDNEGSINKDYTDPYDEHLEKISINSNSSIFESDSDDEYRNMDHENMKSKEWPQEYAVLKIVESIDEELCLREPGDENKPRIVDVLYKKKPN